MAKSGVDHHLHVVMLPWSAFGHMIPFYQLATALAKQGGVRVSYMSTPRNIDRLPKIPPHLATLIQYITLPMPKLANNKLPEGAEATVDVEFDEIQYLKAAYDLLLEPFKRHFISCSPIDWIITDFAANWMPEFAQEHHVKLMYFSVYSATGLCFWGPPEYLAGEGQKRVRPTPESWTVRPPYTGNIFPPSVALRSYEADKWHNGFLSSNASGITDGERLAKMLSGCDAVGVRSCNELEGEYIELYKTLIRKAVVPVGLLPPEKTETKIRESTWIQVFNWLDQQKPRSVVYVGFGSEYKLSKDEVYEIANGLELAELAFIWALRRPTWAADDSQVLPPHFRSRTSGKGLVCLGWAPQLKILGHPSIGGSLFHSGWGSIIETLEHGHNLVLLPFIIDQGLNARAMVAKGLGVEVDRRQDGSYTGRDVADALRRAMFGAEADNISARTRHVAAVFGDHKHYISRFIEFLKFGHH